MNSENRAYSYVRNNNIAIVSSDKQINSFAQQIKPISNTATLKAYTETPYVAVFMKELEVFMQTTDKRQERRLQNNDRSSKEESSNSIIKL